jgi:death-on-curing protein
MTDDHDSPLSDLLNMLRITLQEPIDFRRTDTDATMAKVRVLAAAATYLNIIAIGEFGGRAGAVRAQGLVEQVVGAAFQTFGDKDPHPGPFDKAAMLLRGITQGHPFNDGNKRTGFLVAMYYLDQVGHPLPPNLPEVEVVALCLRISAGEVRSVDVIAEELQRLWGRRR